MAWKLVDICGGTPEAVAYALLLGIAKHEGKDTVGGIVHADRAWLISTYRECMRAVSHRAA